MEKTIPIKELCSDPVSNIALDTISIKKQALVFVSSKRGAESQAEKIALKIKGKNSEWEDAAEKALNSIAIPTKQCRRLFECLKKGIAFHHSGLHSKQRDLIEEEFRKGNISIICATPTLALGMNLPSFRTVVRDLKRYGFRGYQPIPVLEYMQFIGRSGRPDFNDTYGEAISIAETEEQKKDIIKKYINGFPEDIQSKLALEPILRSYVLSLIATEFCKSKKSLYAFFEKTFYGFQYGSIKELKGIINKILNMLEGWGFIKPSNEPEFKAASELEKEVALEATTIGRRVSELYLDPYTASMIISGMKMASAKKATAFSYLNLFSNCLELRPLLNVKMAEYDEIIEKAADQEFLVDVPPEYSEEYDEFLCTVKTAMFFEWWINEKSEEDLLERFGIRPGEIHTKLNVVDWIVYSSQELCKLLRFQKAYKDMVKLRIRIKNGVKEELLPLLKLKNIGRVRSRLLHNNNFKSLESIKKADFYSLAQLIGKNVALDIKSQVGQNFSKEKIEVKPKKRKGQRSLKDY